MTTLLIALALFSAPYPATPMQATAVKLTPKPLTEVDPGKSVIRTLTWNESGTELCLELAEQKKDTTYNPSVFIVIDAATGKTQKAPAEPAWAAAYRESMKWKSAPGDDTFAIALSDEQRKQSATSIPMGGDYARGGIGPDAATGTSVDSVSAAAAQLQMLNVHVMKIRNQTVGEWINQPIVPGQSYGWGPKGSNLIAFAQADQNRQLYLMDKSGAKQKIDDTKSVYSPSFSLDGKRLAWIELRNKKANVVIADVQ